MSGFPAMRAHEGVWTGSYRHLDAGGALIDMHRAQVRCEFPASGPFYVQSNRFCWRDGRVETARFEGRDAGDHVAFDTPTFSGRAWESGALVLLELDRKDEPGARFTEIIVLAPDGRTRARTWHWFKNGRLVRRTLCDEARA